MKCVLQEWGDWVLKCDFSAIFGIISQLGKWHFDGKAYFFVFPLTGRIMEREGGNVAINFLFTFWILYLIGFLLFILLILYAFKTNLMLSPLHSVKLVIHLICNPVQVMLTLSCIAVVFVSCVASQKTSTKGYPCDWTALPNCCRQLLLSQLKSHQEVVGTLAGQAKASHALVDSEITRPVYVSFLVSLVWTPSRSSAVSLCRVFQFVSS